MSWPLPPDPCTAGRTGPARSRRRRPRSGTCRCGGRAAPVLTEAPAGLVAAPTRYCRKAPLRLARYTPYGWLACGPVTSTSGPSQWPARRMARRRTRGSSARFGVPRLVYARPSSAAARGRRATKYAADQFTRGRRMRLSEVCFPDVCCAAHRVSLVVPHRKAHVGLSRTCLFHPT
jgi:hypothetical protein